MNNPMEEKLKNFLNLFWLRPESALLCTFQSEALEDLRFESPSIDISCGDGLFMFLNLGGIFDSDFDYFRSTRAKEFTHTSFIDIYDLCKDNYKVEIIRRPTQDIDFGTDWKQELLSKASELDLYKDLILHDNNKVPLPFPDNYFKTIFSDSVYWVKDVERLLFDIHRMLKPDGTAIFQVMTPYHLETLERIEPYFSKEAIAILDRKRRETMPSSIKFSEWRKLIIGCDFKIVDVKNVYPNKLLIDIWNIGLRPVSHLLIQMSDTLSNKERHRIKQEWVKIFFKLFEPLLSIKQTYPIERAPYITFKLRK